MNKKYYTNLSPADIKQSFTIETVENTAMFKLIVTTTDPTLSYNIAHQMEESVPEQMEETNNGLVQTTVEDKAIKPNTAEGRGYLKNCLLGAVAGLLIAAAYVILRDLLDVRIKSAEELSQRYDVPVLLYSRLYNRQAQCCRQEKHKERGEIRWLKKRTIPLPAP